MMLAFAALSISPTLREAVSKEGRNEGASNLVFVVSFAVAAWAREGEPEQANVPGTDTIRPVPVKPVKPKSFRPCQDGYEMVLLTEHNGRPACAKDIVPINE